MTYRPGHILQAFLLAFVLLVACPASLRAQTMTDQQVINYIQEAKSQGKSQKDIYTGLTSRGVTQAQLERIRQQATSAAAAKPATAVADTSRQRMVVSDTTQESHMTAVNQKSNVFGRDMFGHASLTFEPNMNMATPANYPLGPGDEVIIDIWGDNQTTLRYTISPDGSVIISDIGPVYLNGMTVSEANAYLQKVLGPIYAGISGDPASKIKLTLGQIRTIQINIMGEVQTPGTYALSPFASVFHALYKAGGVNDIGSLRDIRIVRDNKCVANIDVYDYILNGKTSDNIRLMEGDVIIVQPYENLVTITGKIRRPMIYEMKEGETLASLLSYAGDFTGDAYMNNVRLIRKSGREHQIYNIEQKDYPAFALTDGDSITVDAVLDRFGNRLEITGAVYRSGLYELNDQVGTVRQLVEKAEGVRGDAFLNRAVLRRERPDLTTEIVPVDLRGILAGTAEDIPLQRNDALYIPSIRDLQDEGVIVIRGAVNAPDTYPFTSNMTLEDLVITAGGLKESASTVKVDVFRRIKDPTSSDINEMVSKTYTFGLKDGLIVDGTPGFVLEPYDEVFVRFSPGYQEQRNVTVTGEVLFAGTYAFSRKNERLSDLVRKAHGVTPDAYLKGARLIRTMNDEERAIRDAAVKMAAQGGRDSIAMGSLELTATYNVGIELDKALAQPGSDFDIVLREGDQLIVPERSSTVKINGAVLYPNTVTYIAGKKLKYYINQGGGYRSEAKRSKVYVVHMNGTVSRVRSSNAKVIEPGCEIMVPTKSTRRRMTLSEIMSLGTTAASLGTMGATISNLIK
ncbi:MAG: SLBB domain-containing protein [Rikenellaceae bacterium]|nr:SLBB domain-containing protein [Rikenellaceae bacterium]